MWQYLRLLMIAALAATPASGAVGRSKQECIDRFQTARDACMRSFEGKAFSNCMKDAVDRKNRCLSGEVEVSLSLPPASVTAFTLAELGLGPDAVVAAAPGGGLDAGGAEAAVSNGRLVIATPGDAGAPQLFEFQVSSDAGAALISVLVDPVRALSILAVEESDGEGNVTPALPLSVAGLGNGNAIGGGPLTFSVVGAPPLSAVESRFFVTSQNGQVFNATSVFSYDAASNSFRASQAAIASFAAGLPLGELEFSVSLVSEDFSFAQNYSFRFLKPSVTVTGQLVDEDGNPIGGDAADDLNVAVIGFRSGIRQVVNIDAAGRFSVAGLIVETYNFVITDLQRPNVFTGVLGVFPGTTSAQIRIFYDEDGAAAFGAGAAAGVIAGSTSAQNGSAPASNRSASTALAAAASASGCPTTVGDETFFTVQAGARGQNQTCAVNYTAPAGTAEVMIEVEVSTEEFPVFTTSQSQFNDSWSYSLNPSNVENAAAISDNGLVNDTHVTSGTIKESACVTARRGANGQIITDPPIMIEGSLSAQNVGDGILPTRVEAKFTNSCGNLFIQKAELSTPNQAGQRVIAPVNVRPVDGNRDGRFLSIKTTPADGAEFGLPLRVEYAPADADVTDVLIALVRGGSVIAESNNLLTGGVTAADGEIDFANLVMPQFNNVGVSAGRVSLSVQIKGRIDSQDVETERGDVNVEFDGANSFTPLWLAETEIAAAARRYGQGANEPGDDNWSLASTINWLSAEGYRFNDVSAQHVAQTAAGRSVLNHSGHSDGSQIDLRYVTSAGNFDDGGNLAANEALVSNAFTELASGSGATQAQERLAAWIRFNRSAIEGEAAAARRIYLADGNLGQALSGGTYSNGAAILNLPAAPGQPPQPLGQWSTRPLIATPQAQHRDHWHIALD